MNPEAKKMKLVVNTSLLYGKKFEFYIPENEENSYEIDWGDGNLIKSEEVDNNYVKHTYQDEEKYTVTISGVVKQLGISTNNGLIKIEQWGELGLESLYRSFYDCYDLTEIASPTKNSFKDVTNFYACFGYTGITSIPENLFKKCSKVDNFQWTFANCYNLENYLELWKSEYYEKENKNVSETTVGESCFGFKDSEKCLIQNFERIPEYWRKPAVPQ